MEVVLRRFGGGLLSLAYKSCKEVKLTNLVHCVNLQKLRILVSKYGTTIFNTEGVKKESIDPETFLPSLKMFESQICLGEFSKNFEQTSTLTQLQMSCCHEKEGS